MAVKVEGVQSGSPAEKAGIKNGEKVLTINGEDIIDVLDYRFYQDNRRLKVEVESVDGKVRKVKIKKGEYDELGLEFSDYLMDKQHSCRNNCIFCFIDQMPGGMRDSLYFKDDDSRLSFLFGNYITLTNLSEHEISRIITMHISPVNISVHTTNPTLRCKMMNNRFAGECLSLLDRFNKADIKMNCQLVLCPGYNDGDELKRSLSDLLSYKNVQSIAAVPVGLTKFREGLTKLTSYDKETAAATLDILEEYGEKSIEKYGERKVFGSDEFYLLSERSLPEVDFYGDFLQLDNGVGMWSLFKKDAVSVLENYEEQPSDRNVSCVTGTAAAPLIKSVADCINKRYNNVSCNVCAIENDFFGRSITVAGLVTGGDIIKQLKDKDLGSELLIPNCMLRFENDKFLDDTTVLDIETALGVKVKIIGTGGDDFIYSVLEGENHG